MLIRDFPIGPRATVSANLLRTLTQAYNLGTIIEVTDLGGSYNLNLALDTPGGWYVARVYRPWLTVERLHALHTLKQSLRAAYVPTILPLQSRQGGSFISIDGRLVELEPFLVSDCSPEALPSYAHAATMLGHLHNGLRKAAQSAVP